MFDLDEILKRFSDSLVAGTGFSLPRLFNFGSYENSRDAKRIEHSAEKNMELEQFRQWNRWQEIEYNANLQKQMQMTNRETNILVSRITAQENLKNTFWQDAIRRFPLNISPLSILENNGINIESLIKGISEKTMTSEQIKYFRNCLIADKKPLNIFILPVTMDSRIGGRENIIAQVWDAVYLNVESIFVNEYNCCGNRPVSLYSTAWNQNVKPGLHASEELYFFLRNLPTVVIEPRYDGKRLKILFTCWGIGYTLGQRVRQEFSVDFDCLPIITTNAYNRSKKNIKLIEDMDIKNDTFLMNKKESYLHNIKMYEDLMIGKRLEDGNIAELSTLGDYSKWFALDPYDWGCISDGISNMLGVAIATISDVHHLLSSDVEPILPHIYDKYFSAIFNQLLAQTLDNIYCGAYLKLMNLFPETQSMRALEYLHSVRPLRKFNISTNDTENITFVLDVFMHAEQRKSIKQLFRDLNLSVRIENKEDRDFLSRLYEVIIHSDISNKEEYLNIINNIIEEKWK